MGDYIKAGLAHEALDLGRCEAEAAVSMFFAQEFEHMRGEVDHDQPAPGAQSARGLPHGARRVIEIMQHLMHDHEIVAIALHRQRINVALPQ